MKRIKRYLKISAITIATMVIALASFAIDVSAIDASEVYQPGATVVKDENSASGYTVHFVFDPDSITTESEITSVSLTGDFLFVDSQATAYTRESIHTPHEYQNGMYPTGQASYRDENGTMQTIGGYSEDMEYNNQTGNWELSFPITTGSFTYHYNLTLENGSTESIGDPANPVFIEGEYGTNGALSIVCGIYDEEKQSALPNMDYVREPSGARGNVEYVEYQDYTGNTAHLGIYTPANYDENRSIPYKVIYLSHGSGGNETDWFETGHADEIMDNYINQGITEEAIIVTMNNEVYNWNFDITLPNILENVIPYVEANYNVSTSVEDRAMCGLSGGGRTTIAMYYNHPEAFGYFGVLSGGPRSLEPLEDKMDEYTKPTVMAMVGTQDSLAARTVVGPAANSTDKFLDVVQEINPEHCITTDEDLYVYGAHDWLVWTQGFARFLSDCVWSASSDSNNIQINGTQKAFVDGDDWGPAVTKTVITLDQKISSASIGDEENEFNVSEHKQAFDYENGVYTLSDTNRNVIVAYTSDSIGNRVDSDSKYITIEMYVSPTEGSPFVYDGNTGYNNWCTPYELNVTLNGTLTTANNEIVNAVNIPAAIDVAGQGKICPDGDKFVNSSYTAQDGITYSYASFTPEQDDKQNALVIWLHGAGEGQSDPQIAYLGNRVTAFTEEEFQNTFDGAYVLVPQAPTAWMDDGTGEYTHGSLPSMYDQGLFELIDMFVKSNPDIDPNRVIIGGCSNGGYMTIEMLLQHPDYFAAAFPICQGWDPQFMSDEMVDSIKDIPMWFTYAMTDSLSEMYSIPLIERLQEAGASNLHVSEFDKVTDVTGRFDANGEPFEPGDTPYEYNGHWSWILFDNNQCYDENGVNAWQWLAKQVKTTDTTNPDQPGNIVDNGQSGTTNGVQSSVATGDKLNYGQYVLMGSIAMMTIATVLTERKRKIVK